MKEDTFGELYTQRMLVFLETDPQTNKYNQLILNPARFKIVSGAVADAFPPGRKDGLKEGYEASILRLSDEEYDLPSELQDITYETEDTPRA